VCLDDRTLFTICCEGVYNAHPDVARSALVRARVNGRVMPVLCVEPVRHLGRAEQGRVRRALLDLGAGFDHTAPIETILFHPSFPVDIRHNSKIFREKLAVWAERKLR
jgi:olefin beta-lactone synthetase